MLPGAIFLPFFSFQAYQRDAEGIVIEVDSDWCKVQLFVSFKYYPNIKFLTYLFRPNGNEELITKSPDLHLQLRDVVTIGYDSVAYPQCGEGEGGRQRADRIPEDPVVCRVRKDISWKDVLESGNFLPSLPLTPC